MDPFKLHGASFGKTGAGNLIRRATMADVDNILELIVRVYGNINVPYTRLFIETSIENPFVLMLCTDRAFGASYVHDYPFLHNSRQAHMEFLGADSKAGWDAYFILKKMIQWGIESGAGEYFINTRDGMPLAAFAKRLHVRPCSQGYSIKFNRHLH